MVETLLVLVLVLLLLYLLPEPEELDFDFANENLSKKKNPVLMSRDQQTLIPTDRIAAP